jgi:N-methylhydantoinase B
MMAEFSLHSLDALAEHILAQSRKATRAAIARLPDGRWEARMQLDGYDEPIELRACLNIEGERLVVDYAGTSPASARGINSPKCYTDAYSVFGLKCLVAPEVPNNAGSLEPFEVVAPEGTIVSPGRPSPVTARHVVGQMLPDLMFGCLAPALGGRVPAESAGSIWVLAMAGRAEAAAGVERPGAGALIGPFNVMSVGLGGTGARPNADGLATTAFPSGVGGIPVEVTEAQAPVVFWHKEFLADSGGAGRFRGGIAQRIVIGGRNGRPFTCNAATFDRRRNPARGRNGGADGAPGEVFIETPQGPKAFTGKGTIEVPAGCRLRVDLPGGGGFGDPALRDPALLARDLERGVVTEAAAVQYRTGEAGAWVR